MNSIELTAPAKVNLYLRVLNKRKDSYHNILTLFERISLADEIKISKTSKGIAFSSDVFITEDEKDNLAYKAAKLILGRMKVRSGVKIEIKKRIPIAAGLGGGSSDAASVLVGINKLFRLGLRRDELISLAKKLGSDVPFFVLDTPYAIGKGRGDKLEKVNLRLRLWHLLIYPGFKVSTQDIYDAFDFALTRKYYDVKMGSPLANAFDLGVLESMLYNELEDIVVSKKPGISIVIERLASSLGKKAIVSGSGPSVFCLYETRREAIAAKEKLLNSSPAAERKDWQIFIAKTGD
jgi:4-diphosphocytidyl-2-C-methyl-D-erythritol kinase